MANKLEGKSGCDVEDEVEFSRLKIEMEMWVLSSDSLIASKETD